ncbi:MAG: hypothetical protein HYR72_22355 [Deltaproteobacteria bacterium]|nr:hypothetical protein [Deltaproteobacteria bacterium]MBI3390591.1 hypothetical protein [Deltaproteobacteria bacterium]
MHWFEAVSYFYGLQWIAPQTDGVSVVMTLLVINICNACMARLLAYNNGYNKNWGTGLGFVFGIWAVAILMVLPKRQS